MNRHHVLSLRTVAVLAAALLALPLVGGSAHPDSDRGRPDTYQLTGDTGGSKIEGIGAEQRGGVCYVSEVTGGEIHRGTARSAQTSEWLPEGADGRITARGITVEGSGRVYIAGGPDGLGTGRPDLWVFFPAGDLLAALRAPGQDVFLNDVTIGADGRRTSPTPTSRRSSASPTTVGDGRGASGRTRAAASSA